MTIEIQIAEVYNQLQQHRMQMFKEFFELGKVLGEMDKKLDYLMEREKKREFKEGRDENANKETN